MTSRYQGFQEGERVVVSRVGRGFSQAYLHKIGRIRSFDPNDSNLSVAVNFEDGTSDWGHPSELTSAEGTFNPVSRVELEALRAQLALAEASYAETQVKPRRAELQAKVDELNKLFSEAEKLAEEIDLHVNFDGYAEFSILDQDQWDSSDC